MQQQLHDEEERERTAQNGILEQKEKLAENARNAEREKKLEQKYDELSKDTSSEILPSLLIPIKDHFHLLLLF